LAKLEPARDTNWSNEADAPEVDVPDFSVTMAVARGALVCRTHQSSRRERRFYKDLSEFRPSQFACRLAGRIESKGANRAALTVWLDVGHVVRLYQDGVLDTAPAPANEISPIPRKSWNCKRVMRPPGEPNELLVLVQGGWLRAFVNDEPIGEAVELPGPGPWLPGPGPWNPGYGLFEHGGGESRIELTRFTIWDIDVRVPIEQSPSQRPADSNAKQPET
jgi:hypothetical protein